MALEATTQQVGALTSIPTLIASIAEIKTPELISRFRSRVGFISNLMFIQAILWLAIILTLLSKDNTITYLIILFTVYITLEAIIAPAWGSLMSDLLPENKRGSFFGWRGRLLGTIGLFSIFTAGLILNYFGEKIITGFITIFLIAFITKLFAAYHILRMYEPKTKQQRQHLTFTNFTKQITKNNFGRFVLSTAFMRLAQSIAGPFFIVYMLRDLQMSYIEYTLIITATAIASLMTIRTWGKLADKYGNIELLKLASLLIAIIPFLWLISKNPIYLIIINLYAGMAWAGYELTRIDFVYDNTTHNKRERIIAYNNVFNGVAMFIGTTAGGYIAIKLPTIMASQLLALFIISGILRLIAVFSIRSIKEVRPKVKKTKRMKLLMKVSGLSHISQTIAKDFRNIYHATHGHKT